MQCWSGRLDYDVSLCTDEYFKMYHVRKYFYSWRPNFILKQSKLISFCYLKKLTSQRVNILVHFYLYHFALFNVLYVLFLLCNHTRARFIYQLLVLISFLVPVSFLVLMRFVLNWYFFPSLFSFLSIFLFASYSPYRIYTGLLFFHCHSSSRKDRDLQQERI